uniref:BZIP domain-containing protein n=1 Tax=Amorphochlora amoebiformis TaxID=1561963 RepID=A0A7S0DP25_9EUKA|mmetsp:Transcript_4227/g.6414  ORF Transcript_4227/g.6414 Transcript_4227/m.6414 type:complete len:335 (+) Transcript_4227:487-1491(+)|eukprot:1338295-Amorphochlora_amoeboformis.AAC.1
MMMNDSYSTASGFFPLSPLLCDPQSANPFLKMDETTTFQSLKKGIKNPPLPDLIPDEKISGSVSSKSETSSDNESLKPLKHTKAPGATIAVNKQEVMKLIEEQNLQKQRLLRKAEQARLSRKRKKMRMQELEKESDNLRNENKRLKTLLAAQKNKIAAMNAAEAFNKSLNCQAQEREMYQKLREAVDSGESKVVSGQLEHIFKSFKDGRPNAEKYLENFATRISPSLPVRFLRWILSKQDSFYEDKNGLWKALFSDEAELTAEQIKEMKKLRAECASCPMGKAEIMEQIRTYMQNQLEYQDKILGKLGKIMQPEQMGKFLLWIEKHGEVCIKIR